MSNITEDFIRKCSSILGRFDSESVNLLVTLFHHQNGCSQLIILPDNLKEKFENLLTTKTDDDDADENRNDTPLTRIELATMIDFKEKYLSEVVIDNDNHQLKSNVRFSVEDELNIPYCYLMAQIDDRLSNDELSNLKFLLSISVHANITSLFGIYQKLGENFPNFFLRIIQTELFSGRKVFIETMIRDFQVSIKRYKDFLVCFEKHYKPLSEDASNCIQTDAIANQNVSPKNPPSITKVSSTNSEQPKQLTPVVAEKSPTPSVPRPVVQQSIAPPLVPSNIPQKGLCVIINIAAFHPPRSNEALKRAGSDRDVDLIKVVFNKLSFTILECSFDFKKDDLDRALNHVDDRNIYGSFDCLVVFIMSHGLLHSFITADFKEVIIRDIVKRYADSSPNTIWAGKPRLFFIQACRSPWPKDIQSSHRSELKQSDLSPRMLVAYSCSAREASKRHPTYGSIFIQVLCVMLLKYGHYLHIQNILDWTAKFVIKRDENSAESKKTPIIIQRPEYIERDFSSNFRFCASCLYDKLQTWTNDKQIILIIPLRIWKEIYDLVFFRMITNH